MSQTTNEATPLLQRQQSLFSARNRILLVSFAGAIAEGYDFGIINGVLVCLDQDPALRMQTWQVAMLLGLSGFCAALASGSSGYFADVLGRKGAMCVSMVVIILGALWMAAAQGFFGLLSGRCALLAGVGLGLTTMTTYLAEVAPANKRGFFTSLADVAISAGLVLAGASSALLVGMSSDWRYMVALGAVMPCVVLGLLLVDFIPESPRYLMALGRTDEAQGLLNELLEDDKEEVENAIAAWSKAGTENVMTWPEAITAFRTTHIRPFMAGAGAAIMAFVSCHVILVTSFSSTILTQEGGMSDEEAMHATFFISIVKLVCVVISSFFAIDYLGRRMLLMAGCVIGIAAAALLAAITHFKFSAVFTTAALCLMAAAFAFGFGPVLFCYTSEVFETRVRAKGAGFCFFLARTVSSVTAMVLAWAVREGSHLHMYLTITAINCFCFLYAFKYCPETKSRSLEELAADFKCNFEASFEAEGISNLEDKKVALKSA